MPILDRLAGRLLARPVERLVRQAIAEQAPELSGDSEAWVRRRLIYADSSPSRLHVDPTAVVNNAIFNLSSGEVTIGPYAFFGHNVAVLTGTHDFNKFGAERQVAVPRSGRDVVIGEGAWVSSFAIIVGPCSIGEHAVVGVGSLVLGDVEPYAIVAGSPARKIRTIPRPDEHGPA